MHNCISYKTLYSIKINRSHFLYTVHWFNLHCSLVQMTPKSPEVESCTEGLEKFGKCKCFLCLREFKFGAFKSPWHLYACDQWTRRNLRGVGQALIPWPRSLCQNNANFDVSALFCLQSIIYFIWQVISLRVTIYQGWVWFLSCHISPLHSSSKQLNAQLSFLSLSSPFFVCINE